MELIFHSNPHLESVEIQGPQEICIVCAIKKVSVIFVLTSPLRIEEVKALCTMLIKEYAKFNDIVWM